MEILAHSKVDLEFKSHQLCCAASLSVSSWDEAVDSTARQQVLISCWLSTSVRDQRSHFSQHTKLTLWKNLKCSDFQTHENSPAVNAIREQLGTRHF